jgi:hypothetical protein
VPEQVQFLPSSITVVLPDGQGVTGLYKVAVPALQNTPDGREEPAWYVVWVKGPDHVKPVPGVSYDVVLTTWLPPPPAEREILGPRRPSGWVCRSWSAAAASSMPSPARKHPLGRRCGPMDPALDAGEHPRHPAGFSM